jgi:hypothetical protein
MSLLAFVYETRSFLVLSNFILSTISSFQAGKTLSARKWQAAFSADGCLDIASVLRRIQTGVRFLIFGLLVSQSYLPFVLHMFLYDPLVMFMQINMICF